jgi:hypothetical protein
MTREEKTNVAIGLAREAVTPAAQHNDAHLAELANTIDGLVGDFDETRTRMTWPAAVLAVWQRPDRSSGKP